MAYGSQLTRVAAKGSKSLTDYDIYKLLLLCKTERGIINSSGNPFLQTGIFSMNDFFLKCGGFNSSYNGAYVAQSFYDELNDNITCEMKVLSYVDISAAQASYSLMDQAGTPAKLYDVKAGYRGYADKSAFGNKVAIRLTNTVNVTMKLTADVAASDTVCFVDSVDNLQIGYYISFYNGTSTEKKVITDIDRLAKKLTFAAISTSGGFTAALTTISRLDWKWEIGVRDYNGQHQRYEIFEAPFAMSNTLGIAALINDTAIGSQFITIAVNSSNTTVPGSLLPANLTSWTVLTGGSDGSTPTDNDWKSLATNYLSTADFAIMLSPESSSITHNDNMINFCTDNYRGMFYCQAANNAGAVILRNFGASLRGSIRYGMIPSDKWIKVTDYTTSGGRKAIPKVGIDAAAWFNTYSTEGEWKVAAGNKSSMVLRATGELVDPEGIVHDDKAGVGDNLIRNYSVNITRFREGKGITNNSARTLSTDEGYKYQNQIMQWILYGRSIVSYLQDVEQDVSGSSAQEIHYNTVLAYMMKKYKAGAFFVGKKEDGSETGFNDVVTIVNDFTNNTFASIAAGKEQTFVQFISPPPIEEPELQLASAGLTMVKM